MNDFAAAAMLRLIRLGLQRQNIAITVAAAPPSTSSSTGSRVPLAQKRALLDTLLSDHGPLTLLRIGAAIRDVAEEPMLIALLMARDPLDLFTRWQRLERYVHSRHRITVAPQAPTSGRAGATVTHFSLAAAQPPTAAEHLLVLGVLTALLERLGCAALRARICGEQRWRFSRSAWASAALPPNCASWQLSWQTAAQRPDKTVAVQDWVQAARDALEADPGRSWTLASLARELRAAPRTLQRRLASSDSSFSALLMETRLASSARLLVDSQDAPAEIGYHCGFADQAHFTRSFRRYAALTPGQYRQEFRADGGAAALASRGGTG